MSLSRREFLKVLPALIPLLGLTSASSVIAKTPDNAPSINTGLFTNEQLQDGYFVGIVRQGAFFSKSRDGVSFQPIDWTADAPAWQRFTKQDFPYHVTGTTNSGYAIIEDVVDGKKFQAWVRVNELKTLLNNAGNPQEGFSPDQLQPGSWIFPYYNPNSRDFLIQDANGNPDFAGSRVSFTPQIDTPLVLISTKFINVPQKGKLPYHQVLTPDLNLVWLGADMVSGGRARKDLK